jgi:hypothetical protein
MSQWKGVTKYLAKLFKKNLLSQFSFIVALSDAETGGQSHTMWYSCKLQKVVKIEVVNHLMPGFCYMCVLAELAISEKIWYNFSVNYFAIFHLQLLKRRQNWIWVLSKNFFPVESRVAILFMVQLTKMGKTTYTNWPQNKPNVHRYTKILTKFSVPWLSKIFPNRNLWYENILSGNPGWK